MALLAGFESVVVEVQDLFLSYARKVPATGVFGPAGQQLTMPGFGSLRLRYYPGYGEVAHDIRLSFEKIATHPTGAGPVGWNDLCAAIVGHPDEQVYVYGLGLWQKGEDVWFMPSAELSHRLSPGRFPFAPDDRDLRALARDGVDRVWDALSLVHLPYTTRGLELLTEFFHEDQLELRAVLAFTSEVRNGGFSQYFINSTSDMHTWIQRGLRKVGDDVSLDLLARAAHAWFGVSLPDQKTRREIMDRGDDDVYDAVDDLTQKFFRHLESDKLDRLMRKYLDAHPAHFYRS